MPKFSRFPKTAIHPSSPPRLLSRGSPVAAWALVGLAVASIFTPRLTPAANRQWALTGTAGTAITGSWGTAANWNAIPTSADTAFFANITGLTTITLDGDRTVGGLTENSANGYNVTINTGTGGSLILAKSDGTVPQISVNPSLTLTINSVVAGTQGFNKVGAGILALTNAGNTLIGGISVSAGTLTFTNGALGSNTVTAVGGTLQWAAGNTQDIAGQIKLLDGVATTISPGSNTTVTLSTPFQLDTNGTGSLTKGDGNTFIITAANTYTGGTRINNGKIILTGGDNRLSVNGGLSLGNGANFGTLQLGDASGISNQTVTGLTVTGTSNQAKDAIIGGNAGVSTLTVNLSADSSFAGTLGGTTAIQNSLALVKTGTAKLTLTGTNTFTGGTSVNSGTLALGSATALSVTGAVQVAGGTLDLAGFNSTVGAITLSGGSIVNSGTAATLSGSSYAVQSGTISAALGGTGILTKTTAGTVTLSGANTYSGGTNISEGTLVLGCASALGSAGPLNISGGTLDLGGFTSIVGAVTLSGGGVINSGTGASLIGSSYAVQSGTVTAVLSGAGGLLKTTSGLVTLSAANTYTGATEIAAGTLNLTTASAGHGTYTIDDGASLGVKITTVGQSLLTSSFTLGSSSGGATVSFDLGTFGVPTSPVIGASAFTVNGSNVLNLSGAGLSLGQFTLIDYGSGTISGTGFAGLSLGTLPARVIAHLVDDSANHQVDLDITGLDVPKWSGLSLGTPNGNWDIDNGAGTQNWKLTGGAATGYLQGSSGTDSVIFDDTATGTTTVNLTTALSPISITVNNSALTYTFTGPGKLTGTTNLLKQGTGKLILANGDGTASGSNDLSGTITIAGGILQAGDGATPFLGQLGVANILLNGGTLALFRPLGDDFTLTNSLSGAGTLLQQGPDVVTLAGNNLGFSGTFVVSAGTLKVGSANALGTAIGTIQTGGIFDLTGFTINNAIGVSGGTLQVTSGTGTLQTGAVTLSGSGGIVDVASGANFTISGAIGGSGGLIKNDAGTVVLFGNNNYTGTTLINAGTVQLGNAQGLGSIQDGTSIATGATLDFTGFSIAEPIQLNGGTIKITAGTNSALNGAVTVNGGGIVDVATSALLTINSNVGGSGGLTKNNTGTLLLAGTDNYGATTINAGTVLFASAAAVPASGQITLATGTTVGFGFNFDQTFLTAQVATTTNAAVLALGADDTHDLDFTNYPALSLGASGSFTYSGTIIPGVAGYFFGGGGGTLTVSRILTGTLPVTIGSTGTPGTVILTGNNTFSGTTVLTSGILRLGSATALGPSTNGLTINGGTLDLNGFNLTVGALNATTGIITDNSSTPGTTILTDQGAGTFTGSLNDGPNRIITFVKDGAATLIINKANTYSGGTIIDGGVLDARINVAQVIKSNSSLTFTNTGTFRANTNSGGAGALTLGTLAFNGGEGTVEMAKGSSGTAATTGALTLATLPTRAAGATGFFTFSGSAATVATFKVVLPVGTPTGQSLDGGLFFITPANANGTTSPALLDFAAYDAAGYIRPLVYTDSNATDVEPSVDQPTLGSITNRDVQLGGAGNILAQGTDTLRSLRLIGTNTLTLADGATLTISGGGILKTGGTTATITGGAGLLVGGSGDLVVRTGVAADALIINTSLPSSIIGGVTKSGNGSLTLGGDNSFLGTINVYGGTLQLGSATALGNAANSIVLQSGTVLDLGGFAVNRNVQFVGAATLRSSTGTGGSFGNPINLNGNLTIDVGTGAALAISGAIGGTGNVTKTSLGTATLSAANTFTGNVTISSGALRINSAAGLGAGPKTVTIAAAARPSLLLDGSAGHITLGAGLSFLMSSDATGGIINEAGDNVINGNIAIYNGGGGFGRVAVQGGSLLLAGNVTADASSTNTRTLVLDGASNGVASGIWSNGTTQTLGLEKDGTGTWAVTGVNTYTGATSITAGTLQVANFLPGGTAQPLGAATTAILLGTATTTGTLEYTGTTATTLDRPITVNGIGGGVLKNSSGALWTLAGTITKSGRPLTFTGGAFNVTGKIAGTAVNSDLIVNHAIVTLSNAANTYNGVTSVIGGGALLSGATNAIPMASTLTLGEATNNTGGTFDLHGFDQTLAGLSSAGTGQKIVTNSGASGGNNLLITGTSTFDGSIQDGASTTSLVKTTGGSLTLAGASTYTGATVVDTGTVVVTGSLSGTTFVSVGAHGVLGGSGSLTTGADGSVIISSGGSLAPGNNGAGTLTLALGGGLLDLSAAAGGTGYLKFELGISSDKIALTSGALNLGTGLGLSDFSFSAAGGFGVGTYVLFDSNTDILGSLGSNVSGNVLGFDATLGFSGGADGRNELVLTVVPEPSSLTGLFSGLGLLLGLQRFRRRFPATSRF